MSAENDTVSAETALEGLNKWIDQNKSKWDTQEEAQAALDKVLAKGTLTIGKGKDKTQYDLSILNRIDATIGKNGEAGTGNLIAFNRPIDYKYDNVVRGFSDIVTANNQMTDGSKTANNLADDITFTEPEPVKAPETKAPSANDGIDAVSGADTAVDFLISSNGREYILTCRSPGKPFYPISEKKRELSPNELLLTGLFEIRHEYIFGLNSTKLTIGAER